MNVQSNAAMETILECSDVFKATRSDLGWTMLAIAAATETADSHEVRVENPDYNAALVELAGLIVGD